MTSSHQCQAIRIYSTQRKTCCKHVFSSHTLALGGDLHCCSLWNNVYVFLFCTTLAKLYNVAKKGDLESAILIVFAWCNQLKFYVCWLVGWWVAWSDGLFNKQNVTSRKFLKRVIKYLKVQRNFLNCLRY